MDKVTKWIIRNVRFLFQVVTATVCFLGTLTVILIINSNLKGGIGLTIALIAGVCLILGILLSYWNLVDWLNIRVIKNQYNRDRPSFIDGRLTAFSGTVRSDDEPMTSPFTDVPCAAYTYSIAVSRGGTSGGRSRRVLAQGFHLNKTRVEGSALSLKLLSLPSFEDDMCENRFGTEWTPKAEAFITKIASTAIVAKEREQVTRLLEAKHTEAEEFHQDFSRNTDLSDDVNLITEEEVLPLDQPVCVVGTFNGNMKGLSARKPRLGPNLIIYKGNAEDVISRVGGELASIARTAMILIGIGILPLGLALLPVELTSTLPFIGGLFGQ
jgi:hypothetical protein